MPAVSTAPYDSSDYVMNAARVICNDAGLSLAGVLLASTQPYANVLINQAYRTLQEDLTANGVETFAAEAVLENVLPCAVPTDPGVFVSISYTGYNDGANNHANPKLPANMVGPLKLEERQSGSVQVFVPMFPATDGLVSRVRTIWLRDWEWRSDAIWLNGAIQSNDIRLRYNQFLPELSLTANPVSPVMILRSDRAMAYQISKIFAEARGSPLAGNFEKSYQSALDRMVDGTARRKQRRNTRRIGMFTRSRMGSWGWQ